MKRAAGAHEVLDGELSPTDLAATLGDIDRLGSSTDAYRLSSPMISGRIVRLPATPLVIP